MRTPIQIVECENRELVEAELFDEVTVGHFLESQIEWRPIVLAATELLARSTAPGQAVPHHFHWNWSSKERELQVLAFSFFGITCNTKLSLGEFVDVIQDLQDDFSDEEQTDSPEKSVPTVTPSLWKRMR